MQTFIPGATNRIPLRLYLCCSSLLSLKFGDSMSLYHCRLNIVIFSTCMKYFCGFLGNKRRTEVTYHKLSQPYFLYDLTNPVQCPWSLISMIVIIDLDHVNTGATEGFLSHLFCLFLIKHFKLF